jgi:hypothetical protein
VKLRIVAASAVVALIAIPAAAAAQPAKTPSPTFAKDVGPILQRSCQVCHRPGSIAPMSLMTYQDVRPWARAIAERVSRREMPPWYIDRNVGIRKFRNDPSLSDAEIETIVRWTDAGAPQGDPADLPPPRTFEPIDKWHIGPPDFVVTLPQDLIVPAAAADRWVNVVVDTGLTEDRYIQAVETKPSKGFKVVHHTIATMMGANDVVDEDDPDSYYPGLFLNEYALGKYADVFPDGAARLIKAGTRLNFELHLHAIGEETPANVELGLKFYPKGYTPKYIERTIGVGQNPNLDIPPDTDNVRHDGYFTLTKPARLLSFQPHMHKRGKAMCVEAIYPPSRNPPAGNTKEPNKVETLSCVDRYQFGWHVVYFYDDDEQPLLPAGTLLHVTAWHNNSPSNRANPDSSNVITYGNRTMDEMGFAWMSWYYLTDEDYKQMTDARRNKKRSSP